MHQGLDMVLAAGSEAGDAGERRRLLAQRDGRLADAPIRNAD
jgi:hypothetical protein